MNPSLQVSLDLQHQMFVLNFLQKDMHSGMRSKIESEILAKMKINLENKPMESI